MDLRIDSNRKPISEKYRPEEHRKPKKRRFESGKRIIRTPVGNEQS
jgi:hypothetical protein